MSNTSTKVEFVRPNGAVVSVADLTSKILNERILDDNEPDDYDILLANQAMERVVEEGLSDTIEGLLTIDPKSIAVLTALIYTGIKLKGAEYKNSLTLREVTKESHESP